MGDRDAGHDRWEPLAVGHVLGGLDQPSASSFRRHLVGCRQCQAQVAELRELAGSLEDAARDERAVLALRTRARREVAADEEPTEQPSSPTPRRIVVALVVIGVAVLLLAAHNIHLRVRQTALEDLADRQVEIIRGLGTGLEIPVTFPEGASGTVVADGSRVAWSMTGLPIPASDQRVVVWLAAPEGDLRMAVHTADSMPDGEIAGVDQDRGASELQVTLEHIGSGLPTAPSDEVLARADLSLVRSNDPPDQPAGDTPPGPGDPSAP